MPLTRAQIAMRIAQELKDGYYVNLGIGIPTLVANYIPQGISVQFQSENGLLGMGGFPAAEEIDPDLINAGKQTITATPGAAYFSSADSFAMIRGGHVDLSILGAFEVDQQGNIASWMIPKHLVKGMGGAMDLVSSGSRIIVAMAHANKKGESKILRQCQLPLTGVNCVTTVVTDLAVLERKENGFILRERAPGVSVAEIKSLTDAQLEIPDVVLEMSGFIPSHSS